MSGQFRGRPRWPAPLADPPIAPQPTHTRLRRAKRSHHGTATENQTETLPRRETRPLIRKTFDIEFSTGSQKWFEQVMLPWAARTGATHTTTKGNRVRLTDRTKHALLPLAETEQKACA